MQPVHVKNFKSKEKTAALLAELDKCRTGSARNSTRIDGRKYPDDHFKELAVEFISLAGKFEVVLICVFSILGSIKSIKERLEALEKPATNTSTQPSTNARPSYANVVQQSVDSERLGKLEYRASKDERRDPLK